MKTTINHSCTCGAHIAGTIHGSAEACAGFKKVIDTWLKEHSGEGHGPCSSKAAAWARRKANQRDSK